MTVEAVQERFVGKRVDGLDLRDPLSEDLRSELRGMLGRHSVLVFNQPDLTVDDQVRVLQCFGTVQPEEGLPEPYAMISNAGDPALVSHSRALLFHSDAVFRHRRYVALSLYALEVPAGGAPTLFARTAASRLPAELVDRLRSLHGVFLTCWGGGDERYLVRDATPNAEIVEQPLVVREPIGHTEVVMVDQLFMGGLAGMDDAAYEALRAEVGERLYTEANVYRHDWEKNDLVVWSNFAVQHGRPAFSDSGRRVMRRVVAQLDAVADGRG